MKTWMAYPAVFVAALVALYIYGHWHIYFPQEGKVTHYLDAATRCTAGIHDLPDAEDAWNAGWGTGIEAECLRCGRSFRLGVDNLKMCWGPTAAELAAERDALQAEHERQDLAAAEKVARWTQRGGEVTKTYEEALAETVQAWDRASAAMQRAMMEGEDEEAK